MDTDQAQHITAHPASTETSAQSYIDTSIAAGPNTAEPAQLAIATVLVSSASAATDMVTMAIPIIGATTEIISSSMIAIAAIAIVIAMASKQNHECVWSSVVCGPISSAASKEQISIFWRHIFGVSVR